MDDNTTNDSQAGATPNVANTRRRPRWKLGILDDPESGDAVPGSVLFVGGENEPLGLARESRDPYDELKRGPNGVILNPQPDDHESDPLNWPVWRREGALWTIGLYSLIGGGQTPILAAGFNNVAQSYGVTIPQVALTTGVYMLGLAIGAVVVSPFAILYGKRPLYLAGAIIFCAASIWAAASPSYASLVVARVVMGIGVSPCECLPSAYLSEIFYLHERGFRLGIYTLLLLGGKNLVPLVSGIIIESKGWRWVFWIVAIIVGTLVFLLFLFVPETYWVRYAHPPHRPSLIHRISGITKSSLSILSHKHGKSDAKSAKDVEGSSEDPKKVLEGISPIGNVPHEEVGSSSKVEDEKLHRGTTDASMEGISSPQRGGPHLQITLPSSHKREDPQKKGIPPPTPFPPKEKPSGSTLADLPGHQPPNLKYTRHGPKVSFQSQLSVWNGRLRQDTFWKVLLRPLGNPYGFNQLQTGLVYISPFIGGILGSAVAGKLSDVIVKVMAKKNNGLYEPEFRLVMAIGVALATSIGLMGFGWSAYEGDKWIVPTVFFGIISFGCSLGSTTAITFAVDSYRQYAAEALVTLNFSKSRPPKIRLLHRSILTYS
ncbi:hypothetical protein H072_4516 [Dactylellina haptotyla CBS 200.50]|uniref:Major facilitator superfamily (MFS) profile domain-containing protein n=1 Tax=Dactylellina haptotyla (strain CBS 200.50) TaxID=1284197 RepID=S8AF92_DACHA|nr:hypothetical protein H072_4516 [Dactylellina haptotyla CBS 200.50]